MLGLIGIGVGLFGAYKSHQAGKYAAQARKEQELAGKVNEQIARKEAQIAKTQVDIARLGVNVAEVEKVDAELRNKTAENQAQFRSDLALVNADIAEGLGTQAIQVGKFTARRKRKEGERVIASQRAALAANGIVVDYGTALDLTVDTATEVELDAMLIEYDAEQRAYRHNVEAYNLKAESAAYAYMADVARTQGEIDAYGADLNILGAKYGVQGAELAAEGAELAIEGAKYGVRAQQYATRAAKYQNTANTLSLLTSTAQTAYDLWGTL